MSYLKIKEKFPYFRQSLESDGEYPPEYQCLGCKQEWEGKGDYCFCPYCGIKFKGKWVRKNRKTSIPIICKYPIFALEFCQEWPNFAWIECLNYNNEHFSDAYNIYNNIPIAEQVTYGRGLCPDIRKLRLKITHKDGKQKIVYITRGKK